ncbi:hypothetical protein DSO57_1034683 [Entomophthora muscae]|uniref:Uncharacterized protein n=1 Tax=Entomophthora muscae TaxID=34485 RepID=A0ACC2REG6_9FUNG|nr:hypothetical protein DSO57_1034683 [Entomophthora muscae]
MKWNQSGHASAKLTDFTLTGLNAALNHSKGTSQSELKPEIIGKSSSALDSPLKNFSCNQSNLHLGSDSENYPLILGWFSLLGTISLQDKNYHFGLIKMLIPICKFVVLTLYLFLLLIWSTSPDLLGKISSSVLRVSDNPSHLLHLDDDLPGKVQDLLISDKHLVKSLTCDDLDPFLLDLLPGPLRKEDSSSPALPVEDSCNTWTLQVLLEEEDLDMDVVSPKAPPKVGQHVVQGGIHCNSVKTQQLGKYSSKIRDQVGNLEACERRHNWIDHHHQSKNFGVHIIASKIISEICEYVVYTGAYGYGLDGVGQYQRGPGVLLGGVELCWLLIVIIARWFVEWPMLMVILMAPNP